MEIDFHAHFFNTRSLPIAGVMEHYGGLNGIAARFLDRFSRWRAADDHSLEQDGTWGTRLGFAGAAQMAAPTTMTDAEAAKWIASETPAEWLRSDEFDALRREAARTRPAVAAVATAAASDTEARRKQLAELLAPPAAGVAAGIGGTVAGGLGFIVDLLRSEKDLVDHLAAASPTVGLFVYHMMDMQRPFGSDPDYHYARVVARTRRLCQQSATRPDGRGVVAFVAFDAYRPGTVEVVSRALFEQSFVGVKFYPACGFRPDDNAHAKPSPEHPNEAAALDARCAELFKLCAANDIPILSHCSTGGMEVVRHVTGANSNPAHWENVLATYPNLRVCFGHAGGESRWFNDGANAGSWLPKVIALCTTKKNVYLDISHKEELLEAVGRERFAAAFAADIKANDQAAYPLRTKVMYGSDYPMLLPGRKSWDGYPRTVREMFAADPRLQGCQQAVFRDNALRFLNLPTFVDKRGGDLTAAQKAFLKKVLAG